MMFLTDPYCNSISGDKKQNLYRSQTNGYQHVLTVNIFHYLLFQKNKFVALFIWKLVEIVKENEMTKFWSIQLLIADLFNNDPCASEILAIYYDTQIQTSNQTSKTKTLDQTVLQFNQRSKSHFERVCNQLFEALTMKLKRLRGNDTSLG